MVGVLDFSRAAHRDDGAGLSSSRLLPDLEMCFHGRALLVVHTTSHCVTHHGAREAQKRQEDGSAMAVLPVLQFCRVPVLAFSS